MKKFILIIYSLIFLSSFSFSDQFYQMQIEGGIYFETNTGNILDSITNNTTIVKFITNTNYFLITSIEKNYTINLNTSNYFYACSITNLNNVYPYTITNLPEGAKTNIIQISYYLDSDLENIWQDSKAIMLKTVENMYVTFLTNEWTTILREKSLITTNDTITVTNTSAEVNITYLMQLRSLDTETNKPTYSYYKGEFESFRNNIERAGGIMSKVIWH